MNFILCSFALAFVFTFEKLGKSWQGGGRHWIRSSKQTKNGRIERKKRTVTVCYGDLQELTSTDPESRGSKGPKSRNNGLKSPSHEAAKHREAEAW